MQVLLVKKSDASASSAPLCLPAPEIHQPAASRRLSDSDDECTPHLGALFDDDTVPSCTPPSKPTYTIGSRIGKHSNK